MSLATFGDLKAAIAAWITRPSSTDADLADWIALCEARLNRELRVSRMLARETTTAADEFIAVPPDFLAARWLRLTGPPYTRLGYRSPEQMAARIAEQPCGPPDSYSRVGGEFWLSPAPADPVELELLYYAQIPALADASPSNWVLGDFPDAYLHGAVLEAALYFEDTELADRHSGLFAAALEAIRSSDARDAIAAPYAVNLIGNVV